MKLIVTAGGQGTKLWPYSTRSTPKQFNKIIGDTSLYTQTIEALLKSYSPKDIYVSTKRQYMKLCLEQSTTIPLTNYLIEPDLAKGRGPGEGYAFVRMSLIAPDEPFMLVQPDCVRQPEDAYLNMISQMEKLVIRDKKFISCGVKATYPVLGVDYLKLGNKVKASSYLEVYEVDEFIERNNDYYKTKDLVENFHVITHSNHNCWYPELMLNAYKKHRPDWYKLLMSIKDVLGTADEDAQVKKIYSEMAEGSTEEVTKNIFTEGYIVILPFKWTDIGTWDSVYEFFTHKGDSYTDGNVVCLDSKGSVIKGGTKDKVIAVLGVTDLVIVDTPEALLVMPRDRVEEVKKVREELKKRSLAEFL